MVDNFENIISFVKRAYEFSLNDFKKKYSGSALGVIWGYVQIIILVIIYWLAFQFGLKAGAVNGVPFLPWFISGFMPWLLFSDIISSSLNCMSEYSYIVKKVMFNIDIIPIAKILSCLFVHVFFLALVFAIVLLYGINTGLFLLQIIYYFLALMMLVIPLAFVCSVVSAFLKDFGQIISVLLNILMWTAPIVWNFSIVPESFRWIFMINPMFYIITGFRDSLLYSRSISSMGIYCFYFWGIVAIAWFFGIRLYKKILPHLPDVL